MAAGIRDQRLRPVREGQRGRARRLRLLDQRYQRQPGPAHALPASRVEHQYGLRLLQGYAVRAGLEHPALGTKADLLWFQRCAGPNVQYVTGPKRFLLTGAHTRPGQAGVFDSPNVYGPWTTVSYVESRLGLGMSGEYWSTYFPIKWQSEGGTMLWATFSCHSAKAPAILPASSTTTTSTSCRPSFLWSTTGRTAPAEATARRRDRALELWRKRGRNFRTRQGIHGYGAPGSGTAAAVD